jgi:hypothetical protein
MRALLGEFGVDPPDQGRRVGREIEEHRPRLDPGDQAVAAVQRHRLDLGRAGQRGHDHVALLGERLGRVGPTRAGVEMGLRDLAVDIVNHQVEAGLLQVGREMRAHGA